MPRPTKPSRGALALFRVCPALRQVAAGVRGVDGRCRSLRRGGASPSALSQPDQPVDPRRVMAARSLRYLDESAARLAV